MRHTFAFKHDDKNASSNRRLLFIAIVCMFAIILPHAAYSKTPSKLKRITTEIKQLKANLFHERHQRTSQEQQLKNIEINIGKLALQLNRTKHVLKQEQAALGQLTQKEETYKKQLQSQQQSIAQQVRTAYILGNEPYLKMLLNQQDSNEISRMMTYYRFFIERRVKLISNIKQTLSELQQTKQQIARYTERLMDLQNKLDHTQMQQRENRTKRQAIITQLNHKIRSKQQHLTYLLKNKQSLEHLIIEVKRQRRSMLMPQVPFNRLRGKLSWPTRGHIVTSFGMQIGGSQLRSQGIVLSAPLGQNIYAIAAGRVVFANWMPGYGLLLIINHGNGYMTIYGRNNTLYAKTGDTVAQNQLIAQVGESGGYSKPGLYFSIRHNGKALNPRVWCNINPSASHV